MNQRLIHLVASTLEKPWDWAALSANPCITQQDIEDYPFIPWNWATASDNPNITLEYVLSHLERDWNFASLSSNPSLTIDHLLDHPDHDWDWLKLSRHKNITWQHIQEYSHLSWNFAMVSANPNITMSILLANSDILWSPFYLSYNPRITLNDIRDNPTFPWDWHLLSSDKVLEGLTAADVINPRLKWNISNLSANPSVTMDLIDQTPEISWDYHRISHNPNLTLTYVLKNSAKPWDWDIFPYSLPVHGSVHVLKNLAFWNKNILNARKLSYNASLTLVDVLENPDIDWSWATLSSSLNLHDADLQHHKVCDWFWQSHPWFWPMLSVNKSLRLPMIDPVLPWDWTVLSGNTFQQ